MKFIDLFGGVGGFRYGIEKATDWKCVWYNEYDKYAVSVYNKQFNENWSPTDIRTVKVDDIPDFDVLCGGFPCQAFSIAGKRRGFKDTRGTMFFEIARILKAKRPKYLFLENVKGLLNHSKGETFKVILQTLEELGYETQWMVLNSKFFGVPQNRERVFIIGNLRGERKPEILPFRENAGEVPGVYETEDSRPEIGQAKRRYGINGISPPLNNWSPIIKLHRANEIRESKDSPTLTGNMGTGGNNVPMISGCLDASYYKGTSPSHMKQGRPRIQVQTEGNLRRLTPIECERLQGFPDGWTDICSDTQRYKQMGNAVTTNVISAIVKQWVM